jgi:hypothetical protein
MTLGEQSVDRMGRSLVRWASRRSGAARNAHGAALRRRLLPVKALASEAARQSIVDNIQ